MRAHELVDHGEADAAAGGALGGAAPPEALEHVRQIVRRNAGTGVGDGQPDDDDRVEVDRAALEPQASRFGRGECLEILDQAAEPLDLLVERGDSFGAPQPPAAPCRSAPGCGPCFPAGFETDLPPGRATGFAAAVALDRAGRPLGRSATVAV